MRARLHGIFKVVHPCPKILAIIAMLLPVSDLTISRAVTRNLAFGTLTQLVILGSHINIDVFLGTASGTELLASLQNGVLPEYFRALDKDVGSIEPQIMLLVIEQFHALENCHRVAQQEPRIIMEELLLQTPHQSNQRIVSELPRVSNKLS